MEATDDDRSHRPGHPLAKRLWSLLRDRSEADRRLVYEALLCRLEDQVRTANQEIALEALRRFVAARTKAKQEQANQEQDHDGADLPRWADGPVSKRRYTVFRQGRHDPKSWPSASMISKAFDGQWTRALEAAGLIAAPDVLVRRRTARGDAFSITEVQQLLLEWAQIVDADADPDADADADRNRDRSVSDTPPSGDREQSRPLYFDRFIIWLENCRRDPDAIERRLPSRPTVRKLLGTWVNALDGIGMLHRHPEAWRAREADRKGGALWDWAKDAVAGLDLTQAPTNPTRTHRHDSYSKQDLLDWLGWLTGSLNPVERPRVRVSDWTLLRQAAILRALEAETWFEIPSVKRILDEEGIEGWPAAKVAAGIADAEETSQQRVGETYAESELYEAVVRAAQATGELPSRSHYTTWREQELTRRRERNPWIRIPSDLSLCLRLCRTSMSWEEVLEVAIKRRPELAQFPRPKKHGNAGRRHKASSAGRREVTRSTEQRR
jgi:hypothetical protein